MTKSQLLTADITCLSSSFREKTVLKTGLKSGLNQHYHEISSQKYQAGDQT